MKLKGLDKILLLAARAKAAANAAAIGTLTDLDTTDKSNLVDALNETYNIAVGYSSDGLKEDVSTLQDEVEVIESAIRQINPTGAATATVTAYDTVNSLPANAAQAGLGIVQEGMTATNLVTNGDFSNGTTGWGETASTSTVANKILSNTGNGLAVSAYVNQVKSFLSGNVYYASAKMRVTNPNCTVMRLRTNESSLIFKEQLSPTQNQWYIMSGIITIGATIPTQFWLQHVYADAATANGKVMEVDGNYGVKVVNLTAIAKEAATLSQADAMLLDYFSGTQSAVTGRVRSVGKNLFDGVLETGTIDASGVNAVDATKIRSKNFTKVKPSVGYILSNGSSYTALTASFYDKNKVFISQSAVNYATFTTPALTHFIRFQTTGTNINALIQLELGSTATTYEPYRKTESYTKPMPLRRVPNNTTDDVTNGKHTKRVSEWANVTGASFASIDNATYTNVSVVKTTAFTLATAGTTAIDNSIIYRDKNGAVLAEVASADIDNLASIGKFYYHTDKTVWRILAKGSLDIATARTNLGTETMIYQLLTPVVTENVSSGTLLAYPSGTVYWEPVIADVAIYAAGATILNTTYPISSLESIYKIDLVTGEQTPLAVASATVASGGLSFTHTGLIDGDLVGFTYYFSHPYPYGENDYTYYNAVSNATYTKGVKTDLVEPNDFTVTTGAEKTLVLATPVYNDIVIQGLSLRVGTTPPTLAAFQDSIYAIKFVDAQADIVYGSFELPHDYKEGTDLELHLHWSPSTTNTGACVFSFAYSIAGMNGTFGAEAVKTFTQAGSGTVNKHQYVSGNTVISGTGLKIGTIIVFALSRPTGDAFTGDAFLHSVGVHYQIDTLGSRTAAAK